MYKLLLCWRYLCTRYIALASIISVTLGVAVMIVVNSVMSGFASEMQNRIHGILSDVIFESRSLEGVRDAEWHKEQIRKIAGDQIEGMTPTVVVPAMLSFQYGGNWITRQVQLIGIDEATQASVSDFSKYLQHPENRRATQQRSFQAPRRRLRPPRPPRRRRDAGADADARRRLEAPPRDGRNARRTSGQWSSKRQSLRAKARCRPIRSPQHAEEGRGRLRPGQGATHRRDPGHRHGQLPHQKGEDHFLVLPGDDVKLTFPTAGAPPKAVSDNFTVVDFYESKMSEYDASFVFVPIRKLQELRGMIDPTTGVAMINSIAIKLKPGADGNAVRDKLRAAGVSPRSITTSTPGATSKAPCWPPCRWKPPSSTCCCS